MKLIIDQATLEKAVIMFARELFGPANYFDASKTTIYRNDQTGEIEAKVEIVEEPDGHAAIRHGTECEAVQLPPKKAK